MKLIRQTKLTFQEGRSDKVYEVDLCEVSQGHFVVNFRYGRRGATLKEGTKTETAVPIGEAEKLFAGLVGEKTRKGYREATGQAPVRQSAVKPKVSGTDEEARRQAILKRLEPAGRKEDRSLDRVIWRAGELKLKEAAPLLLKRLGSGNALRDYCLAWSLGFCGDAGSIPALTRLYQNPSTPDMVKRIAAEALLKLSDEAARAAFRDEIINSLPPELSYLARQDTPTEFASALARHLESQEPSHFEILSKLYLLYNEDNETVRPALLNLLRTAPLRPNYFRHLRHIFKAAEYRRDAEVFGILAHRFEKSRAMFSTHRGLDKDSRYSSWIYIGAAGAEQYIKDGRKEVQSPSSRIGYSSRTRSYLRARVWRTLRRLGEIADPDYVKMAVGVLLPFSDEDAQPVREAINISYRTNLRSTSYWDAYASYWALNHILYHNSPRYGLRNNSKAWRCKPGYKPGEPAPTVREEAFPHLWEKRPEGLLHLIAESACRPVVEFAARALGDLTEFCAQLDLETTLMILASRYEAAVRLGFKLARDRYHAASPDRRLVLALANCALEEARKTAHVWIEEARSHFLKDADFLADLAYSPHADTRAFSRHLLRNAFLPAAAAFAVAMKLIDRLRSLDSSQAAVARDVAETVDYCFAEHLRAVEWGVINSLLSHPMLEAQELGGRLLLQHNTPASELPEEVISALIASPYESMRAIGIQLYGRLDDEALLARAGVIAAFATHELDDVRAAIRPVVRRLCHLPAGGEEFTRNLVAHLLQALLEKEAHEGVHVSLVRLLQEDVGDSWMQGASRGLAWRLVQAKSSAAQELGGLLLLYKTAQEDGFADNFDFSDLVELTNHEVLSVRQASWSLFAKMRNRLQSPASLEEMGKAVKLLDAKWDDSRDHWFRQFDDSFTAQDFTPAILVSVCDSVRPEVQAFGRRLITRFFADEDGPEYLLKLSEHPSAELQTFATNYLERYAADDPQRLEELKPYFLSVLSRVNRARVAKNRVLKFLTREAQKSEAAARLVSEILTRQSVTAAIGDKAAAIEAMLLIHRAFPQVALPLEVRQPEVRNAF